MERQWNAFQFSATSLQDYADCPRRFQLRYLLQVAWPAPQAEPVDEHEGRNRAAREFHRLVHQHLLGLPADTLSASVSDLDLDRWWRAYLAYASTFLGDRVVMPEVGLSSPAVGYRLYAQYDAIAMRNQSAATPTDFLILDWKTYRQRPSRVWLAKRLQTRVYPLVLVQAGAQLIGGRPVEPDEVEMRYWLAEYPETPESFHYDVDTYQADLSYVTDLISEIVAHPEDEVWPLTDDVHHCRFCNYRSLCDRGTAAGSLAELLDSGEYDDNLTLDLAHSSETDLDFDLDWGQVQEIAY